MIVANYWNQKLGRFVYSISYFDHLRMYLRIHQNNTVQNSDNLYHSVQATSNWTRLHHIWYHPRDWQLGIFLSHLEFEIHLFTLTCLLNALVFYKSIKDFLLYYFPFFWCYYKVYNFFKKSIIISIWYLNSLFHAMAMII